MRFYQQVLNKFNSKTKLLIRDLILKLIMAPKLVYILLVLTLYQLLPQVCASMPYDDSNVKKMIRDQLEKKVAFSKSKPVSKEVKDLIGHILEVVNFSLMHACRQISLG